MCNAAWEFEIDRAIDAAITDGSAAVATSWPDYDRVVKAQGESGHWVALGERAWHIETVWQAAAALPVDNVSIEDIRELDEDCWFDGNEATVRAIVEHARRMNEADPGQPVILASDGQVLDGMHRIAKSLLDGHTTVRAQRLPVDPEPDWLRTMGQP